MAREFRLPDLGEGIHEGEVLAVKVSIGQQVKEDDVILEVETDKAAVEIPSPYTDVITGVRVKAGDVVHVGDVMMVFGGVGDNEPKARAETPGPAQRDDPAIAGPSTRPHGEGPVPAAPSTRRLARELGVDLHKVVPTGPGGRVTQEDVRAYLDGRQTAVEQPAESARPERQLVGVSPQTVEAPPLPAYDKVGPVERLPLRSVRRATAKQMALSWSQIPHVSTQDIVDITELEKLRQQYKDEVKDRDGALTLTVFAMKALVHALKVFPKFNASLDMASEEILLKKYYNIGIAVDTERGLLVPSIRDVDQKSVFELAVELKSMAKRARDGQVSLEDMQGSTMTITNVGAIGGTNFTPIINYPEAAILGLAQARVQPVAKQVALPDGEMPTDLEDALARGYEFVPRLMMPIILTFDHRINDGAEAQRFLNRIIEYLEHPERLLMGL